MSDRGYINLIRNLTRATSTLPLETLQASIAHYLARPSVPIPGSPTPLAAATLSSPLFRPYTHRKLGALSVAFRHAVHMRFAVHREEAERHPGCLLARGVSVPERMAKWVRAVLEGCIGSEAVMRIACVSGLLLGLGDWEQELEFGKKEIWARVRVEEEVVLALAEVVDGYTGIGSGWEKDFKKTLEAGEGAEDILLIAILLASQCAPLIDPQRLQALPLPAIIDVLTTAIGRAFHAGMFLAPAPSSISINAEQRLLIHAGSTFAQNVQTIASSIYISSMASIAKFTALSITTLIATRRVPGWESIGRTLTRIQNFTNIIEKDWTRCPLAGVTGDSDFADESSRGIATATWSIMKTLLFTTLMLSQSILSAVVFTPSPDDWDRADGVPSPHSCALSVLHTLSHLSFILPQFGGVASISEGGLPELKRVFYMALDVLSASPSDATRFIEELCQDDQIKDKGKEAVPRNVLDAKKAFSLASAEQLVPILSDDVIQTRVYPLCLPYLWRPIHRETYESAHSVMLSIFASHAHRGMTKREETSALGSTFVRQIVPMYAQCLVENSSDGRMSTLQLCMAYAALVRSASSFGYHYPTSGSAPADLSDSNSHQADTMAWFCIEALLEAIRQVSMVPTTLPYSASSNTPSSSSSASAFPSAASAEEPTQSLTPTASSSDHLHRLRLALIATVPSVSLNLLPKLLGEVKTMIISVSADGRDDARQTVQLQEELVEALFKAISQEVGDSEKEFVIQWWYDNLGVWPRPKPTTAVNQTQRHPTFNADDREAAVDAPAKLARL